MCINNVNVHPFTCEYTHTHTHTHTRTHTHAHTTPHHTTHTPQWKPRYVVFKMSQSGRLQLTVYKEQPTVPSNEIKEIPIEEYGGLEVNLRLDSEKYTFAIITNSMTDCFAVETHDELNKWTALLQEYLGKGERGGGLGEVVGQ